MTNDYDPNEKEGYKHQKAYWEEQERKGKLLQELIDEERRKKRDKSNLMKMKDFFIDK